MIKLIVSDLDGTLLNSKQQISDRTLRAIKQIQRKGLRLLINTEQNYFDAKKILDTYEIPCDIACLAVPASLMLLGTSCMLLIFQPNVSLRCCGSSVPVVLFMRSTVLVDYVSWVPRKDMQIICLLKLFRFERRISKPHTRRRVLYL